MSYRLLTYRRVGPFYFYIVDTLTQKWLILVPLGSKGLKEGYENKFDF